MYKVMVNVYFIAQDGYDYTSEEYSGIEHSTREEANKELEEAKEIAEDVYIEEC